MQVTQHSARNFLKVSTPAARFLWGSLCVFVVLLAGAIGAASENSDKKDLSQPGIAAGAIQPSPTDAENARMRALEGSKSPLSLQLNLIYEGSTIAHPLAATAPNPANSNPPPVVSLQGLLQARYRIDKSQSVGVGGGLITEQPFQRPRNTSLSDPTVDYALSHDGKILHNRVDLLANVYTANFETIYGYQLGFTIADDLLYKVARTGLTLGASFQFDYNTFSSDSKDGVNILSRQRDYDYNIFPLAEYTLTKTFNLRTVLGMQFEHTRSMPSFSFTPKRVYQTFGLGVSWTDDVFTYFFIKFYPSPLSGISGDETSFGFNAIINAF